MKTILSKIKNFLNIGTITAKASDKGHFKDASYFQVETVNNEILSDVPYYQQYGFASSPKVGTNVIVLSNNGNKNDPTIIADNSNNISSNFAQVLSLGDVLIWSSDKNYIRLRDSENSMTIESEKIDCNVTIINIVGDITLKGNINVALGGDVIVTGPTGDISSLNHTHTSATPGSPTSKPLP